MPFVRVTVLAPTLTPENVAHLQVGFTDLMESILGKVGSLTSVLVEQLSTGSWVIGRDRAPIAAHVNATITAGTNSAVEKARFIESAMQLLKDVLGPGLSAATYIVVDEVPAQSWGYDGRTQESRRPHAA
jgi:4-oxalocrotonate tautomerase